MTKFLWISIAAALALALGVNAGAAPSPTTILNVSYDPTRELYDDYNAVFASTGRRRRAKSSRCSNQMVAPESRRERSSTVCKPTW